MSAYGQYCPVAKAMEVLGDRWTMLVVRDLLLGVRRFNELARGLPRMSRSLLSKRLKALQDAGIVERRADDEGGGSEYVLTDAGVALWPVLDSLMGWGARWAFDDPDERELDPVLLMWWMQRGVAVERLPEGRVTVEFAFADAKQDGYWLILTRDDVSVCLDPPSFDTDVWVETSMTCLYRVWLGRIAYEEAVASDRMRVFATPALEEAFPRWFLWSPARPAVRQALGRPA